MTIVKLKGIVDSIDDESVVIDVNGVGYGVYTSTNTSSTLQINTPTQLWIESVLKQDQIVLHGFTTELERQLFRLLISVQGAGPKLALALLSTFPPHMIATFIQRDDTKSLRAADGVGPKVANRLVLELKNKMLPFLNTDQSTGVQAQSSHINDAIDALTQLGYARAIAATAIEHASKQNNEQLDLQNLIRFGLKHLSA